MKKWRIKVRTYVAGNKRYFPQYKKWFFWITPTDVGNGYFDIHHAKNYIDFARQEEKLYTTIIEL